MLRSLYSAISGLKNHQVKMDVIGNNIANVNTTGFKRSRVTFSTMLSQTMKGAGSPGDNQGGTNPAQVGLGSVLTSIDQIMTQGSSQSTGKDTDVMIQGSGFFVLNHAGQTVYSRAGALSQDTYGSLIEPGTGAFVMGYMWGADDSIPADFSQLTNIRFALGEAMLQKNEIYIADPPKDGNFPKDGWTSSNTFTDPSLMGGFINIEKLFDNADLFSADSKTKYELTDPDKFKEFVSNIKFDSGTGTIIFPGQVSFDKGTFAINEIKRGLVEDFPIGIWEGDPTATPPTFTSGNGWIDETTYVDSALRGATIDLADFPEGTTFDSSTGTLSFASPTDAHGIAKDAGGGVNQTISVLYSPPTLTSFSIDTSGVITGVYSNGISSATKRIGQLAMANFANDAGLMNMGNSFYAASNNSGEAKIGAAGTDGRGTIVPSSVEMSNVDLSQEFTDMIVTQRGFQANSRVITVSDSLLQELIDLKR